MNKITLCSTLFISGTILSCSVQIHNDSESPLILVDPNGTQALYLEADQAQVIDPSLSAWWYYFPLRYFKKETLYFYTQKGDSQFELTYILTEQYCAPGTEQLSLQGVMKLVINPTDRYTVTMVSSKQDDHDHTLHGHK